MWIATSRATHRKLCGWKAARCVIANFNFQGPRQLARHCCQPFNRSPLVRASRRLTLAGRMAPSITFVAASTPITSAGDVSSAFVCGQRGIGRMNGVMRRRRTKLVAPLQPRATASGANAGATAGNTTTKRLEAPDVKRLTKLFWRLALPYWKRNKAARRDLAAVLVLTLLQSGVSVGFSYISRDFWSALNEKDAALFYRQAGLFFGALCVITPINVYYQYFRDRCALKWREWLTSTILEQYVAERNFYNIDQDAGARVDNPDQRIAQDLSSFTYESLALMLTVLISCIDLVSFSAILYSIYPPLFGAIVAYAATGTALTTAVGRRLVSLNYAQLVKEADMRYSLIRFRDNAESVAFFGGERREQAEIMRRLGDVVENLMGVIGLQRNLGFLQTGYRYLVQVVPAAVVAPLYFAGKVPLGTVTQSFGAFSHILNDLSLVVSRFDQLSQFGAGIERLGEFTEELEKSLKEQDRTFDIADDTTSKKVDDEVVKEPSEVVNGAIHASSNGTHYSNDNESIVTGNGVVISSNGVPRDIPVIQLQETESNGLALRNVSLFTPSEGVPRRLIENLSLELQPGQRLLIAGPSGVGKSSLLRSIAGLWNRGSGCIERPPTSDMFFLPQRPYCTLGSLRANLLYPRDEDASDAPVDSELLRVLDLVDLSELPSRLGGLDAVRDWGDTLSLGEQQRLQLARLLLANAKMAIIDEGSAALSIDAERRMYGLLQDMGITVVSIGHRPSLLKYHDVLLRLGSDEGWELEEIGQEQRDRVVAQVL